MEDSDFSPSHQFLQHTLEQDVILWDTMANLMEIDEALENRAGPRKTSSGYLNSINRLLIRSQEYIKNIFANFKNKDHHKP